MQNKLLALVLVLCTSQAFAQSGLSRRPTSEEIVQRLSARPQAFGPLRSPGGMRQKGITVEGGSTSDTHSEASVDLEINFEFNSAVLTSDAKLMLDRLGRALNDSALKNSRMQIQGHTDAVGNDESNLVLSQSRAKSAAQYLSNFHNISPSRLEVTGFGKMHLANPSNPFAAENRRVKVVNLGP